MGVCVLAVAIRHAKRIFSVPQFIVICGLSGSTIFYLIIS
jgi:predicted DNA-binding transcriptional regulator AlpA